MRCGNCFSEMKSDMRICEKCHYYLGMEEESEYRIPHGHKLNNRYILGGKIGSGGFGITYKAWDSKLNLVVAVKEFFPQQIAYRSEENRLTVEVPNQDFGNEYNRLLSSFINEARNMAVFSNHANIVSVIDYFEENKTAYIVMEYLNGQNLDEFLRNMGGRLDETVSKRIILEVCKGLQAIHKYNIIHRDIKPKNIFICLNGSDQIIKIIDFGAARFANGINDDLTALYTEGFAPIEQYTSESKQGPWTDVYAVGATMYKLITGTNPVSSPCRLENDTLVAPNKIYSDITENTSNSIMRAMAVEPEYRFRNIAEFVKTFKGNKKVISVENKKRKKKQKRFISVIISLMLIFVGFMFVINRIQKQREEETLPVAEIDMWYISDNQSELDIVKQSAIEEIVEEFMYSYDTVTINLHSYKKDEYKAKLKEAIDSGKNIPEVFESTGLAAEYMVKAQNIESVFKKIKHNIYFSNEIEEYCLKTKKLPTSFKMPIVYVNATSFSTEVDKNFEEIELSDLLDKMELEKIKELTDMEAFINQEQNVFYGDSSAYSTLKERLLVSYKLYTIEEETICEYGDTWSVNSCGDDEKRVAERFIEFLYSNNGQDLLYLQNDTGKLPINKSVLKVYEETNWIYEGLFDSINQYDIEE